MFNFGRNEVRNFLMANALYWLSEFHIDGLRVDAVASMLYLDYSRKDGEWVPNRHGGNENLEAISFLQETNTVVHGSHPGTMTIAEESTAWQGVSRPVYLGGLGFTHKWNMGWMHDTLAYFSHDPVHRRFHHHQLTFGLVYAWSENFVLPLSHDEVVHLKGSLLTKMPGDRWQQLANLRALFAWMWAHPGKPLIFMGGEFGQEREWQHDASLDWHLLEDHGHAGVAALVRDVNRLQAERPALWSARLRARRLPLDRRERQRPERLLVPAAAAVGCDERVRRVHSEPHADPAPRLPHRAPAAGRVARTVVNRRRPVRRQRHHERRGVDRRGRMARAGPVGRDHVAAARRGLAGARARITPGRLCTIGSVRNDRGAAPLALIVFVGAGILTLAGFTVWQFSKNTGPNSGDFTLAIEKAEAIRDHNDLPVVTVDLLADFQSDAAAAALSFLPQAQCVMRQDQKTQDRVITGAAVSLPAGAGTSRYSRVKATILPGEEGKAIQGEFDVACAMIRDKNTLYTTDTVEVNVPPPRFAAQPLTGAYATSFEPTAGTCDFENPAMNVTQTDASSLVLSFSSLPGSQFPVTLAPDLTFQFDGSSLGSFKGKFRINEFGDVSVVDGTIDRQPCAFRWSATRRPDAPN